MRLPFHRIGLVCAVLAASASGPSAGAAGETFDVIVRGGTVLDGTGVPRYAADVGIRAGRIARVGDLSGDAAPEVIDAKGLFVAPGFINIHSHPEPNAIFKAENMLTQGVTTEIGNPDGTGAIDLPVYFKTMAANGLATNLGSYIGFNTAWSQVMGPLDRRASAAEVARMRALIVRGLEAGAWGVSAGLDYKPGYFADPDEVVSVLSAARPWRTNFNNHERLTPETGYSGMVGMRETVDVGVKAGMVPVITHMKSQGQEQLKSQAILDLMDATTRGGHYTAADIYPYAAGFNNVRTLLIPAWAVEGDEDALYARFKDPAQRARMIADIERIMDLRFKGPRGVYVLTLRRELTDIMAEWKVSAGEAIIRLNEQYRGRLPQTYLRHGTEEDVVRMLRHPDNAVACDCGSLLTLTGHPRAFGTFPKVLGTYVRELGVLTWEDAIRKMTGLPASTIGMTDRGFIAPGMAADIAVFDPRTVIDKATYDTPLLSEGMRHVLVNGRLALKDGKVTGVQAGTVLLRSPNMPSRPFTAPVARRAVGSASLSAGERLNLDIRQAAGYPTSEGTLTVIDRIGRTVFTAQSLGVLQTAPGWASLTGQGRTQTGEIRAFSLIIDNGKAVPAGGRAITFSIDGGMALAGSSVGAIRLSTGA